MKQEFRVSGMSCASCVAHIENDLRKTTGVDEVRVNFATERMVVTFDPTVLSAVEIVNIVKKTGYTAEIVEEMGNMGHKPNHHDHAAMESKGELNGRLFKLIFATVGTVLMLLIMFVVNIGNEPVLLLVLALLVLLISGREFFERGIVNLLKGRPGMDALVALGLAAAFCLSSYNILVLNLHEEYFMDVGVITTFVLLGRYLEARAKTRAGAAIKKLLELSAKVAHKIDEKGQIVDVDVEDVELYDLLLVKSGEKIPTDGEIVEGSAVIDESMITGESVLVSKMIGAQVIGATINGNTSFRMKTLKVGKETMLAKIIQLVQDAQMSKAPIQKLVDKVSGYFAWGVIIVAVVTFVVWYLLFNSLNTAVLSAVTVLIIACPCALGLATPISIVVGSGKGASLGILLKKPESLEKIHKMTTVCFDKTGTITKGKLDVAEFVALGNQKTEEILGVVYALSINSSHPLAESLAGFAKETAGLTELVVKDFNEIVGKGMKGKVAKEDYIIGSRTFVEAELGSLDEKVSKELEGFINGGYTVSLLATSTKLLGYFILLDEIKENSESAIKALIKRGITPIMLTGDNAVVAKAIADRVGIKEFYAGIKPEEKLEIIKSLQAKGEFVGMIGDGINDSPALAQANIGIAMGSGTDVAIESGDVVLVKGDLVKAVEAIELSEATLKNIKQNLFWAFIYNSVGIPIAALGLLNPVVSSLAMAFSSVSVVLNALRLKKFKRISS